MNIRPHSITIISWIFIVSGGMALVLGILSPADDATDYGISVLHSQRYVEFGFIYLTRILAVLGGVFMLYGCNWARWLLVVWMGCHVILSFQHSLFESLVHSLLFAAILYTLFRPQTSAYFRGATTPPEI